MVTNPGTPAGAGGLLPLNLPHPIAMEANGAGRPVALVGGGRFRAIVSIGDRWRIDDEWWREEISRVYYSVEVEGGARLTIFRDLISGAWFLQPYTPPARLQAG